MELVDKHITIAVSKLILSDDSYMKMTELPEDETPVNIQDTDNYKRAAEIVNIALSFLISTVTGIIQIFLTCSYSINCLLSFMSILPVLILLTKQICHSKFDSRKIECFIKPILVIHITFSTYLIVKQTYY